MFAPQAVRTGRAFRLPRVACGSDSNDTEKVPEVGALMADKFSAEKQRKFAGLLVELAEQLEAHAEDRLNDGDDNAPVLVVPGEVVQPGIRASRRDSGEP